MYLGFYPETVDRQKIAWVGTLLTDTALVWHLHRYRELGENDTWFLLRGDPNGVPKRTRSGGRPTQARTAQVPRIHPSLPDGVLSAQ